MRELSTLLKDKQEVPLELWGDAGVKVGSRLKDVEKEIVALKKNVSRDIKEKCEAQQRALYEEEAERQGVTVEQLLGEHKVEREFNVQLKCSRERARNDERAKKETQRQVDFGEHDMNAEYL